MKTLILLLLCSVTVGAQSIRDPIRRLDGKVVDLRPMATSRASHMGDWERFSAKVVSVAKDGIIVTEGGTSLYFIRNFPNWQTMVDGETIHGIAARYGTYKYQSTGGARTVSGYDYGEPLTAQELADIAKKEAAAIAAQQASIKAAREAQIAEAKARAEKAKAEREKKP